MKFVESRLLGIKISETGDTLLLSIVEVGGASFTVNLAGVEKLVISEFRQQNIIEDMTHWKQGSTDPSAREATFYLMTGGPEETCDPNLVNVVNAVVKRIESGDIELMEITAIFGAQIIALFASLTIQPKRAI